MEKRGELKQQRPEPQVFTMSDIKHKMLVWNIKWLEEQQNQQVRLFYFEYEVFCICHFRLIKSFFFLLLEEIETEYSFLFNIKQSCQHHRGVNSEKQTTIRGSFDFVKS